MKLLPISAWPRCRGEVSGLQMGPPSDLSGPGSDALKPHCPGWAALCMAPTCGYPAHSLSELRCPARRLTKHGPTSPSPTSSHCMLQQSVSLHPVQAPPASHRLFSQPRCLPPPGWPCNCALSWCCLGGLGRPSLHLWGWQLSQLDSVLRSSTAPAPILWVKDICRPCLSTDKGRRCGEPSRPRSRYTLSTSPWCRVVRLVSRPEDWKGVWARGGVGKKETRKERETQTVIRCGLRYNPVLPPGPDLRAPHS